MESKNLISNMHMTGKVLMENFFPVGNDGDHSIREEHLGWTDNLKLDAQSDCPEDIFRYFVEVVGLNILFYWMTDHRFYTIETEKDPIEVRRIDINPNWDGKYEFQRFDSDGCPCTSSPGELLATFDEPTDVWDSLKINGVPIGEVLENSVITDLD